MKIVLFYHSLVSDWNHGNAHFLRGIVRELQQLGHQVEVFEEENNWSLSKLQEETKGKALENFKKFYPGLPTNFYNKNTNLEKVVSDANLVIVHEWNQPELVATIGKLKEKHHYKLLFHDTHHRSVSAPEAMQKYDLYNYDGVLAFGDVIKDIYIKNNWCKNAWTWHEAADTHLFKPMPQATQGDLVWVGNWGDNERTEEIEEFLIKPVEKLGLRATMFGVRYPKKAQERLQKAGIAYGGYLPSYRVPEVFSQYKFTVHIPRRYYTQSLPGIPTIRPFEALACGIPLISTPWKDSEYLFAEDNFLWATSGDEMTELMKGLKGNDGLRNQLKENGLRTIEQKHTCRHRVEQLMEICKELQVENASVII